MKLNVLTDETYSIHFLLEPGLKNAKTKGSKSSRKQLPITKPLLKSCDCKKQCLTKIDKDRRSIHKQYWTKDNKEKWTWLKSTIKRRRRRKAKGTKHVLGDDQAEHSVCDDSATNEIEHSVCDSGANKSKPVVYNDFMK